MPVPVYATKIEVYAGDSWSQSFVFKVGDTPEDLTGWGSWECQWRPSEASSTAVDLTVDTSSADEGVITISATPEQTRAMGRDGLADVQAVDGADVRTFIRFRTVWRRDLTRD